MARTLQEFRKELVAARDNGKGTAFADFILDAAQEGISEHLAEIRTGHVELALDRALEAGKPHYVTSFCQKLQGWHPHLASGITTDHVWRAGDMLVSSGQHDQYLELAAIALKRDAWQTGLTYEQMREVGLAFLRGTPSENFWKFFPQTEKATNTLYVGLRHAIKARAVELVDAKRFDTLAELYNKAQSAQPRWAALFTAVTGSSGEVRLFHSDGWSWPNKSVLLAVTEDKAFIAVPSAGNGFLTGELTADYIASLLNQPTGMRGTYRKHVVPQIVKLLREAEQGRTYTPVAPFVATAKKILTELEANPATKTYVAKKSGWLAASKPRAMAFGD